MSDLHIFIFYFFYFIYFFFREEVSVLGFSFVAFQVGNLALHHWEHR